MSYYENIQLIDAFPDWSSGGGIFSLMGNDAPWAEDIDNLLLDLEYFGNVSGEKYASPLIRRFGGKDMTTEQRTQLKNIILQLNLLRWTKLYATLSFEYNPIENYNMIENLQGTTTNTQTKEERNAGSNTGASSNTTTIRDTGTVTDQRLDTGTISDSTSHTGTLSKQGTETGTDNVSTSDSGTVTNAKTGTESLAQTHSKANTNTDLNGIYGFNSELSVSANDSNGTAEETYSGTDTTTFNTINTETRNLSGTHNETKNLSNSETETHNLTDSNTKTLNTDSTNTQTLDTTKTQTSTGQNNSTTSLTINGSTNDSGTNAHTLTRSGNIGITTSQQMIESERQLWLWNFFRDIVFPDVDKTLTLGIYQSC